MGNKAAATSDEITVSRGALVAALKAELWLELRDSEGAQFLQGQLGDALVSDAIDRVVPPEQRLLGRTRTDTR